MVAWKYVTFSPSKIRNSTILQVYSVISTALLQTYQQYWPLHPQSLLQAHYASLWETEAGSHQGRRGLGQTLEENEQVVTTLFGVQYKNINYVHALLNY